MSGFDIAASVSSSAAAQSGAATSGTFNFGGGGKDLKTVILVIVGAVLVGFFGWIISK